MSIRNLIEFSNNNIIALESKEKSQEKVSQGSHVGKFIKNTSVKKKNIILENDNNKSADIKVIDSNNLLNAEVRKQIYDAIDDYHNTQGKLEGGFLSVFKIRFCCCTKRYQMLKNLYQQGEEKLSNYNDYLDMIKVLQQFNKMKNVILNNTQLNIFDYSFKPRILYNANDEEEEVNKEEESIEDKGTVDYDTIYESYKEMQSIEKLSEVEERLLDKFDDDLKLPFRIMYMNETNK